MSVLIQACIRGKEKRCTGCGDIKPVAEFYAKASGRYGVTGTCKQCLRSKQNKWRVENPGAFSRWQRANRAARTAASFVWRNAEPLRAKAVQAAANATRRAAHYGAPGRVTAKQVMAVWREFGNRCLACGSEDGLGIDHVVPLANGGPNVIENIQPLCVACNASKKRAATDYRALRTPPLE